MAGVLIASPAAVLAHEGAMGSPTETKPPTSSTTNQTNAENETASETETNTEVTNLRKQGQELLQTKRETVKAHTETEKQNACKAHQAEINKRSANYATAAQRHLEVFNKIFTRVQDFQKTKQLNDPNYDTLVATATAKQAAAQTAVDALKALDVSIDCTQPDPATSVATLKTAVANARTALQDYRKAIKDVIVSLKGASTANKASDTNATSDTTQTGGNQ